MSSCTGPGRAVGASRKAARTSSGRRRGSPTTAFHFVSGAITARESMSIDMPRCGYAAARHWLVNRAADLARGVNGVQKVVRVFEMVSEAELAKMLPAAPK